MLNKARILYVEDDATLSFITKDNLEMQGYVVDYCEDGEQAIYKYKKNNYDLCILDIMLPKVDGFTIAKKIRETNEHIPIIFLTAKTLKDDKIYGLKTGADDYITKPFSIEELVLKIEVFLKRSRVVSPGAGNVKIIKIGKFIFDFENLELIENGNTRKLTYKEAELLKYLYDHRDKLIKRDDLLIALWGDNDYFMGRSLDVFISRIRKYFKNDERIKLDTIYSLGFKFSVK